jgi:cobalt-zinc-cadmium resistance protein CzcA
MSQMRTGRGLEDRLIDALLRTHGLVVFGLVAIVAYGVYAYTRMPVDAFPDISPVMVPVFAEAHGMAPEEVERLITYPIESSMNGLPGVTQVKSTSAFGMAVVYVYFRDEVDVYFARQLVAERLAGAMSELPEMHEPPSLGPISTGLGQVFMYYLTLDPGVDTGGKDPNTYLRELNDWSVKFRLRTVPGVTDILSIGGHVLQYQINVDPYALQKYDLALGDVVDAVRASNRNAGGQFLVLGAEEHLVRGVGLLGGLDDIRAVPVRTIAGTAVRIGDLAEVAYGNEIRRGVVTRNGEREVVSGMVLKLHGENTSNVIDRLHEKIAEVQRTLPEGVTLVPYYEQANLVTEATWTVKKALLIGGALVVLTLAVFLGDVRSAFVVALSLPVSALVAIIMMGFGAVSANLMSLGGIAIAIGMLGDGAIVMVENIYRHLGSRADSDRTTFEIVHGAATEVARPIIFSISIIVLVFLPIFTLEGVEGKMFAPMAFTICCALLGSMVMAIAVAPVLSAYILRHRVGKELALVRALGRVYRPMLVWAVRRKAAVLALAGFVFAASLVAVPMVGTEFIPTLEEGSVFIGVTMAPSISLSKATETVMELERRIVAHEEVEETVSRIGRPEAGSHPHPVNYAEIHVNLKSSAREGVRRRKERLIAALDGELAVFPGVQLNFTQPIQNAFDELLSGIKAQLAIKVYGEDLGELQRLAGEVSAAVADVPGLVDLSVEQSFGQPQVQVVADREACARYGVSVADLLETVELGIGGEVVDHIYLNTRRFGIHVRYREESRAAPDVLEDLLVGSADGVRVPLGQIASVERVVGPIQINREENRRRWTVQANVRGRDLGGVVAEIRERVAARVGFPSGYYVEYGGQFENQQRAMGRLRLIVPVVIVGIFLMLWMTFGSHRHAFIIIVNVPLALAGGVAGLLVTGEYLSVPAAVGFIALFGIAVQNGLVLVSTINQLRCEGRGLAESIVEGGVLRLRPVLMTAVTTVLGLVPLLVSTGIGSEVQRPLAVVVVFGLTTSTLLTLFVIPVVYGLIERGRDEDCPVDA